jgi:hypothetical protein
LAFHYFLDSVLHFLHGLASGLDSSTYTSHIAGIIDYITAPGPI